MEAYIYWGDGSKSLGDESPSPWICTPVNNDIVTDKKIGYKFDRISLYLFIVI